MQQHLSHTALPTCPQYSLSPSYLPLCSDTASPHPPVRRAQQHPDVTAGERGADEARQEGVVEVGARAETAGDSWRGGGAEEVDPVDDDFGLKGG